MHKSITNNNKFNARAATRLEKTVATIHALYGNNLLEISVFGSHAKGTPKAYSSIDLLVIIEESFDRFVTRNATVQRLLNEDDEIPQVDPLVYTEAELIDLLNKKESFVISVLKETIVIWNGSKHISISDISDENKIKSRYNSKSYDLEEIEF
jgi:predicted nucleotidyltransferase